MEEVVQGKFVVVVDAADRENEGDSDDEQPVRHARGRELHDEGGAQPYCLRTRRIAATSSASQMTERNETPYGTACNARSRRAKA